MLSSFFILLLYFASIPAFITGAVFLIPAVSLVVIATFTLWFLPNSIGNFFIKKRNRHRLTTNFTPEEAINLTQLLETANPDKPTTLKHKDLSHSVLNGMNLSHGDLQDTDLSKAHCKKANFSHSNLKRAFLHFANLRKSRLKKANLQKAKLFYANLKGADLEEANLQKANLKGADLRKVNHINTNWKGAVFNEDTRLPFSQQRAFSEGMRFVG